MRLHGWRYALLLAAVLALALAWLAGSVRSGQPTALPDVPDGRVACLSYTPRGMVPGPAARVLRAQIEADLALLAAETRCVRTYSSTQGMHVVPEIARRHGLTVLLGIWIGRDAQNNEREIEAALAAAQANPDVIAGIIVGNEVLLRHEQSVESLYRYVERVNRATDLPVTYADVWEFWRLGADLADAVDFVTIHILPYWENEPVDVAGALEHVREIRAEMQAEFPDKRLVIGETGWPTVGRPREGAVPGRVNAARFVREFIAWAEAERLEYNLIEAFDQPWKRGNEGTVGGFWGLFGVDGLPKFPLTGPVTEDTSWRFALALAACFAVLAPLGGRLLAGTRSPSALMFLAATGLAAGAALHAQWLYVPPANRDAVEWAQSLAGLACGWALVLGLAARFAALLEGRDAPESALVGGVEALGRNHTTGSARALSVLRLVLLFGMAYVCLGLALDPRYRDFPVAITALPALLLALRQLLARGADRIGIEERTLAAIIALCATASLLIEGPLNVRALAWNGSCLLLAGALLGTEARTRRREPGQHERSEQHAGTGRIESV